MEQKNRYSIYELIDRHIVVEMPGKTVSGLCQDVFRDPIENNVILVIDGEKETLNEPESILEDEKGRIIFIYQPFDEQEEPEENREPRYDIGEFRKVTREHQGLGRVAITVS